MTENSEDRLIIVIPAYNEESNLEEVVRQWHPVAQRSGKNSRLFIIDDGSTDGSWKLLGGLMRRYPCLRAVHKENQGHGATVLYGYRCALAEGADYVFQTDSDGQTDPADFDKLWKERGRGGLLIGSRVHRMDGGQRVLVTRTLRAVIGVIFGCRTEDANTPFRLMRADQLEQVIRKIPENHPLANVLMTVIYTRSGMGVAYYPIFFGPRRGGKNSLNMKKIVRIGLHAVRDFRNLRKTL